ncbi:hypothetical protein FH972_000098 [Carpinus fangiana]|uniref:KIB1-4 beta-propeller domain-containing protein n=1 Tax=Carpinus fangiana TaxID=176857 RepID=A0A5N6QAL6_9ROSI|nr:hypothetical protein FH972_000098 [Carpinus fangiana]
MESNWACLPEDLILILDKLVSLSDYVRFTAVCMPWYAVALDKYRGERPLKLSMHQPPLLFLTHNTAQQSGEGKTTFGIYSVSENKTFKLKTFIPCDRQRYCDSSHGWMISADEKPSDDKGWTCIERTYAFVDVIYSKEGFKVLVLDGNPKWVETKSLGGGALFLGEKTSTYVSASDFPGCQPNSIYFTDRQHYTCFASNNYDMNIFNLEDGSFQRNCVLKFLSTRKNIKKLVPYPVSRSPPCWIEPTFQLGSA